MLRTTHRVLAFDLQSSISCHTVRSLKLWRNLSGLVHQQSPESDPINDDLNQPQPTKSPHAITTPFVPKSRDEFKALKKAEVIQPSAGSGRVLYVSIIGEPNAGKSTLLNQLVKHEISSVSSKVHTTRRNVLGVRCRDDTQLVFIDTPGIVSRDHVLRHNLESSFVNDLPNSVKRADLIAVLVDVSNRGRRDRINPGILEHLHKNVDKRTILIMNKVDQVNKKRKLLDIATHLTDGIVDGVKSVSYDKSNPETRVRRDRSTNSHNLDASPTSDAENISTPRPAETGWPHFSRLFMLSAIDGDGLPELEDYLFESAVPNRLWNYPANLITDQDPGILIVELVRGRLLDMLNNEIPFKTRVRITEWEVDELGSVLLQVTVTAPERLVPPIIGERGSRVKRISEEVRQTLVQLFKCNIRFKLVVTGLKKAK